VFGVELRVRPALCHIHRVTHVEPLALCDDTTAAPTLDGQDHPGTGVPCPLEGGGGAVVLAHGDRVDPAPLLGDPAGFPGASCVPLLLGRTSDEGGGGGGEVWVTEVEGVPPVSPGVRV
jgi:hypothetical protein